MSSSIARGVLFVHSAPRALCTHVEWAATEVVGAPLRLLWTEQPAQPGTYRAEVQWQGQPGTGAALTSALGALVQVRFEVTQDPSPDVDGSRWSYTPDLGIFHAPSDVHGNLLIPEDRIRAAMQIAGVDTVLLRQELDAALGTAWDAELEPFRYAGEAAPVRYLHRVG